MPIGHSEVNHRTCDRNDPHTSTFRAVEQQRNPLPIRGGKPSFAAHTIRETMHAVTDFRERIEGQGSARLELTPTEFQTVHPGNVQPLAIS
jgi:hypothetical protein